MKKYLAGLAFAALILSACGSKGKSEQSMPDNFKSIGDAGRIDYLVRMGATPDSVARYIIDGALGRNNARIDTFALATNHAYEIYRDADAEAFSIEYDTTVESLPLADKMKVYTLAGTENPQGLGYKLGLEYMASVRDGNKKSSEIEAELKEFKKACGTDTAMYRRFIVGFRTVLKVDRGKDLPEEIYQKFVNYE